MPSDIQAAARLAVQATLAVTDIVEGMHRNISRVPWLLGTADLRPTRGVAGLVYRNIRTITGWVGSGLDLALTRLDPLIESLGGAHGSPGRDSLVSALNGVLGDHLAASGNSLAIAMQLRRDGQPLARAPGGRLLLMIHGLCMGDLEWRRQGHDHGAALEHDLGYARAYLRYNTGRHISENGRDLAALLESFIDDAEQPVTELAIVGHSMGGLVARSACHYAALAGHRWPRLLRRLVFLGTPHLGAPLERGGNGLQKMMEMSPYSAPLAALGRLRSAGITDLRHGSLLDEDWLGVDRFETVSRRPVPVPLPRTVHAIAMAGTTGSQEGDLADRLLGDGLVPLSSALGRDDEGTRTLEFHPDAQWTGYGINHMELLSHVQVYAALRRLMQAPVMA